MIDTLATMTQTLDRLGGGGNDTLLPLPEGLSVMRQHMSGRVRHELYTPVFCLVLRGAKQVALGDDVYEVSAGQALLVSVEVPVSARVQASDARPYLAVAVDLELALCDQIAEQTGESEAPASNPAIARLDEPGERLFDCLARILALAGRPHEEVVLLPGLRRELHYLLLLGPLGATLRTMARPNGHHRRIARAVALLRNAFREPIPIEMLARVAGMSPSAFHFHFKAITQLSPRQYQKQLRLLEARRLMRINATTARDAAFRVGYASAQHFTRDHSRHFGAPPRRGLYSEPHQAMAAE